MRAVETLTVEPDEAGMRLDRWFKEHYPALSFGHLQKLLRSGQVRVDGGRAKTHTRLAAGQSVRVPPLGGEAAGKRVARRSTLPPSPERGGWLKDGEAGLETGGVRRHKYPTHRRFATVPPPRSGEGFRVDVATHLSAKIGAGSGSTDADLLRDMLIYEDDAVFVFNKPPGLAVQGGSGLTRHVDGMLDAWRDRKGQKPRLVHRLDRDTSGVLVVARTRLAAQKLAAAFRSRSTRKIYWALVKGVPKPRQGRISTWLAKGGGAESEKMRVARHGGDDASHAVSLYSVVDQAGQKLAWLSMRPVTGRTHQLRAHAAHIGHPIVGDPKYFDVKNWELPGGMQNKLHLHARRIVMPHPAGGTLDVTAPLPPHMQQSWNLLGFDVEAGKDDSNQEMEERPT